MRCWSPPDRVPPPSLSASRPRQTPRHARRRRAEAARARRPAGAVARERRRLIDEPREAARAAGERGCSRCRSSPTWRTRFGSATGRFRIRSSRPSSSTSSRRAFGGREERAADGAQRLGGARSGGKRRRPRVASTTTSGKTKAARHSHRDFPVVGVVPLAGAAADRDFAPSIPASPKRSLRDWDPPFPIDLRRVRPIDEDYWRGLPHDAKAFIPRASARRCGARGSARRRRFASRRARAHR